MNVFYYAQVSCTQTKIIIIRKRNDTTHPFLSHHSNLNDEETNLFFSIPIGIDKSQHIFV